MTQKTNKDELENLIKDISRSSFKFFWRRIEKTLAKSAEHKSLPIGDFLTVTTSSLSIMSANVLLLATTIYNDTTKSSDMFVDNLAQLFTKQINAMIKT
jgi:hypothetical protein